MALATATLRLLTDTDARVAAERHLAAAPVTVAERDPMLALVEELLERRPAESRPGGAT